MIRVRLTDVVRPDNEVIDFGSYATYTFDTTVLQVVADGELWTFPLANVAYFVTEAP